MKKIGVLGGMSWESTLEYYRIMNQTVRELLGKSHSADMVVYSFDFEVVETLQKTNQWELLTDMMIEAALSLKKAGAELLVIATNTMHRMAGEIQSATGLQVVHIASVTGEAIIKLGLKKVLLLGTEFTMSGDFYRDILESMGIEVLIPTPSQRNFVHETIYEELVKGILNPISKRRMIELIESTTKEGVEGVILGCTEIPLLIQAEDVSIQVLDTTRLHAEAAIKKSISPIVENRNIDSNID